MEETIELLVAEIAALTGKGKNGVSSQRAQSGTNPA